jgi:hypothetical protein
MYVSFFSFFGEAKEHFVDDCHFVTGHHQPLICTIWLDMYLSAIQCQKPDFQNQKFSGKSQFFF